MEIILNVLVAVILILALFPELRQLILNIYEKFV
jgi:hypothetical protein